MPGHALDLSGDAPRHRSSYSVNPFGSPVFIADLLAQEGAQGLPNRLPSALWEREKQYLEDAAGQGTFAEGSPRRPVHTPRKPL